MNNIKSIIKICAYEFRIQMTSKRVWLGYLIGIAIILHRSLDYFMYADSLGETINVLEAFIIAGNDASTIMFIVLGWLLTISEAPFVNSNAQFLICRTNRRKWNIAMLLYIALQGAVYYGVLAISTIIFGLGRGFGKNAWSSVLIKLAEDPYQSNVLVFFPYTSFINKLSVYEAFGCTWALSLLYGVILGMILYTFSQAANRVVGAAAAFCFHFWGYEIMEEGLGVVVKYSLLARSMPAPQMNEYSGASIGQTILIYSLFMWILVSVSSIFSRNIDFKETYEESGHGG